ncbi:response regulator [Burkholderia gladioli]|uniref:response regulator n=1 Tax=Burkholderia gladioli TaxID=28095 RepID=UPI00163F2FEF|nr:response regulator [Burkholderia gladioli]
MTDAIDQRSFRRIIQRNIALPLVMGLVNVAVFIGLVAYLVSTMSWVEHSERVIGDANEMMRLAVERQSSSRGFFITGDERFLSQYEVGERQFQSELDSLVKLVQDNPPQVETLKRIQAIHALWNRSVDEVIELRRKGADYSGAIQAGKGQREFDETRREFTSFLDIELALRQQRSAAARSLTAVVVGTFLLFSLLVSGVLAWRGRRELLELSGTYDDALRQELEHTEVLKRQVWVRSGQRLLAEKMVGQSSLASVGQATLDFLANYLDALVSALYVRDAAAGDLRRVATHGFSHEQASGGSFRDSEGLVGQAASSRRTAVLKDIPATYFTVTSGLGSGVPRNLVVLPVVNDDVVNGVIELAFMRDVEDRDLELLELIANSAGGFIAAAQYRERLQETLAEAQQLNEEMQVQQEELRVANEGLEERGRALIDSQARLQSHQAELEQTNAQLEEYAQRLERQKAELVSAQQSLSANAARLEQTSRYKSEFLANMSHELRTPLNSSLILARLLQENRGGNLTDEQVHYAQTIHSSNSDLLNLINDILDLSKVEAGHIVMEPETVVLDTVMRSMREMFSPIAEGKALTLTITRAPGTPGTIVTDHQRLVQILRNLLSNALKFTERGEVALGISVDGAGEIRFEVRDSGIGIAADKLEMIFEAFQQADGSTSRHYGGSGLGLSISRKFAELLGGRIDVVSEPGAGSVFTLRLPLDLAMPAAALDPARAAQQADVLTAPQDAREALRATGVANPVAQANGGGQGGQGGHGAMLAKPIADDRDNRHRPGRLILAIEDDLVFAGILRDLVHELDFDFVHAADGSSGVALVRDMQPTAVLLDVGLPDRSGLTVLEWLKSDPLTRHIPIHIVAATDHIAKALHLGAAGYTLKPAARATLEDAIRRIEGRLQHRLKRVLVIEDDTAMREGIRDLLTNETTEIVAVDTLASALENLNLVDFDCVVTDLALPDGTGYDLLETLAADPARALLPVIVYTGRALSADEEHRLRRYSKSIIIKGARSPERLLDEVTLFLHSVESTLAPEQQRMLRTVRQRDDIFEGCSILLAEDDARNIFALSHVIEPLGAKLFIARNGREALELLEQGHKIDLILMDVMMPEMDGLAATAAIRKDARFMRLPIIALTAKAMEHDRIRCIEAGADDYISKPIDIDKLVSLCRVWLRQR